MRLNYMALFGQGIRSHAHQEEVIYEIAIIQLGSTR